MEILILDDDELTWHGIGHFRQVNNSWNFYDLGSMEIHELSFDDIDLVIVDISNSKYSQIYLEIIKQNPKKRVIVLSESLKICNEKDCNYCIEHNQTRRIMKPTDLQSLYKMIDSFDKKCDFYNSFENISDLIGSVIKRYTSLIYDESEKEVIVNMRSPSNMYTQELLSFVNILEQNNVAYSILSESRIRLN